MPSAEGADQRLDFHQQRPRALHAGEHGGAGRAEIALGQKQLRRIGDLAQARAGHLEHADLVGRAEAVLHRAQDAELVRAFALEREHRIDHVLDHARAGDLAVLGDVADQDDGRARALGEADQRLRRAAHLRHRAGRGLDRVGPHGLDRVDDDEARRLAFRQRGDDVLDRGLGGEFDRRIAQAQPLGAQPHLADRLFARDIDGALAGARQRRGGLDQQRRFADAGIARHQDDRAAHEAAAGDAVELGDAGGQARGVMRLAGQRLELEQAALAGPAPGTGGPLGAFLGQRIPLAAALALALPAVMGGAAVLADEGEGAFGHGVRNRR